jgi:hypothetical protein
LTSLRRQTLGRCLSAFALLGYIAHSCYLERGEQADEETPSLYSRGWTAGREANRLWNWAGRAVGAASQARQAPTS